MFRKCKHFFLWFNYKLCERKRKFTHRAVSHSEADDGGSTIITYTIFGKRDLYRTSISELLEDENLVQNFNPLQAVKFGVIALGDILFSAPQSDRETKYEEIKNKMFEKE